MSKTMGYYEQWKEEPLVCPRCQWRGTSQTASEEDLPNGQGYCCPQCQDLIQLLIVMFPTSNEKRAHWDQLSKSEQQALERRENFLSAFEARKLKTPDQLPDIDLPAFEVQWDEQSTVDGVDVVLRVESRLIHAEPRTWDAAEHFFEIAKVLRERYGNRVKDLVPTAQSEMYLYGDSTHNLELIRQTRSALQAGTLIHLAGKLPVDVIALIRAAKPSVESERFNDEIE